MVDDDAPHHHGTAGGGDGALAAATIGLKRAQWVVGASLQERYRRKKRGNMAAGADVPITKSKYFL